MEPIEKKVEVSEEIKVAVEKSSKYFSSPYSEYIFYQFYSRWVPELGRRETWIETIDRFIAYMKENLEDKLTNKEYDDVREAILNQDICPSMRLLWSSGKACRQSNVWAYNCSWIVPTCPQDLGEIMYNSMCGCGVGFAVEWENVQQFPQIKKQIREKAETHVVIDSKEGWADAFVLAITTWFEGKDIKLDYSNIRPAGARLETAGGKASGPQPLVDLMNFTKSKILAKQGRRLSNIDLHDIICQIGLIVVAGGVRRCLPYDSLISTNKGLIRIENIKKGDMVMTGPNIYKKVILNKETGIKKLLNINTQLGIFRSSPEHRLAVLKSNGGIKWVQAKNLTNNDFLIHIPEIVPGIKNKLPEYNYIKPLHSTTSKDIIIPEFTEDIAWLIGNLHGDGYVYKKNETYGEVMFACSPDMPLTVKKVIKNLSLFGVNPRIKPKIKGDNCIKISTKSNQLANYFYNFKQPKISINVPEIILTSSPEIRAAYIAGVFDADGSIKGKNNKKIRPIICSSVYPNWLLQLRTVLSSIGISSKITLNRPRKNNWKPLYNLTTISIESMNMFGSIVGIYSEKWKNDAQNLDRKKEQNSFIIPKDFLKNNKNSKLFDSSYISSKGPNLSLSKFEKITGKKLDFKPVKILSIELGKEEQTYDIQVSGDERFIADGFLVHNSAMISLSELEDTEMRDAKKGQFYLTEGQRAMANNSAVYNSKPSAEEFLNEWTALVQSKSGERGIFNRGGLEKQVPSRRWEMIKDEKQVGTNPCISPETLIITDEGLKPIVELVDKTVKIYDGKTWKEIDNFRVTGENQEMLKIILHDGSSVRVTPYHTMILEDGTSKEARLLEPDDKLMITDLQELHGNITTKGAYLKGFLTGDGTSNKDRPILFLYEPKYVCEERLIESAKQIIPGVSRTNVIENLSFEQSGYNRKIMQGLSIRKDELYKWSNEYKLKIPNEVFLWNKKSKLDFIAGVMDADGTASDTKNGFLYQICSINKEWLEGFQTLLKTFGVNSTLRLMYPESLKDFNDGYGTYKSKDCYRLTISQISAVKLSKEISFSRLTNFSTKQVSYRIKPKWNRVVEIISDGIEEKVYCCTVPETHKISLGNLIVTGQCGEIYLRSKQFCNLTSIVIRPSDTVETLRRKIELATLVGTYQSSLTNFGYLGKKWKKNCEAECLLGVSLTGYYDNPVIRDDKVLDTLRLDSIKVNEKYAKRFEINPSTAITCVKPHGNSGQLLGVGSGMHPWFAPYFIRRVRINHTDTLLKMARDQGVPCVPEVGQAESTATTYVLEFPIKAPEGAIFKEDVKALDLLTEWKRLKQHFVEHNPSATIYVGPDEWLAVGNFVYENWDWVGGLSFLPRSDHVYQLAPYETITKTEYEKRSKAIGKIDFSKLSLYESIDNTVGAKEAACGGKDTCDIF